MPIFAGNIRLRNVAIGNVAIVCNITGACTGSRYLNTNDTFNHLFKSNQGTDLNRLEGKEHQNRPELNIRASRAWGRRGNLSPSGGKITETNRNKKLTGNIHSRRLRLLSRHERPHRLEIARAHTSREPRRDESPSGFPAASSMARPLAAIRLSKVPVRRRFSGSGSLSNFIIGTICRSKSSPNCSTSRARICMMPATAARAVRR
jgi:hypothetical protein